MGPSVKKCLPSRTGLWVIAGILLAAAVATSPFWLFLLTNRSATPPLRAISLLPIQGDLDEASRQAVDRLAAGVIDRLSHSDQLEVIPWERVRQIGKDTRDLRAIGSELGADFLVAGMAASAGETIDCQLYLVASPRPSLPSWMSRYRVPRTGAPAELEEKIAGDIEQAALQALR
ncbi:MAG: hypothetical protein HYX74_01520 [Acidobacteria bacterium]|nr:hypothetical protein [Acidobacteriota bacterium]